MGKVQALKTSLSLVRKGANSIPKGKFDPKTLGYIAPDGTINFQNEESAVKYIYNRLHESLALPQEQQFERLIVKKNSSILGEVDGDINSITDDAIYEAINGMEKRLNNKNIPRDWECFHSHPDIYGRGRTSPLSAFNDGDIGTFFLYRLKKIVAINSKEEFNSLEATKEFNDAKFIAFKDKCHELHLQKILPTEVYTEISTELRKLTATINLLKGLGINIPHNIIKSYNRIINQISNYENLIIQTEKFAQIEHEIYQIADDYGMRYRTNFSNLLKYNA